MGKKIKELLHPQILVPTFTPNCVEEVHMILEYSSGDTWGSTCQAACANRVIYSHDVSNSQLHSLKAFQRSLDEFEPDLVVFSGAHLLEGQPQGYWEGRVQDVAAFLQHTAASGIPLHLELATVGNLNYLSYLTESILHLPSSLGLNEQELLSLAKASRAPGFDFASLPAKPGVSDVSDLLHWLMSHLSKNKSASLSRVHFHTLAFHIVAERVGGPWSNGCSSVLAGARTAALQACATQHFDPALFTLQAPETFALSSSDQQVAQRTVDFDSSGVARWEREGLRYYLSPVPVCKEPLRTVGLGDAISASGLLYSQFNKLLRS